PVSSRSSRRAASIARSPGSIRPPGRLHSPCFGGRPRRISSTSSPRRQTTPTQGTGAGREAGRGGDMVGMVAWPFHPAHDFDTTGLMSPPSAAALAALKSALGDGGWTDDPDEIAPWLTEWRNRWQGHTPLMLTPRSTEQVAAAVRVCAEHRVAIVPQGGDTGLVGGQIPFGEVLLSTRKLRAVRDVTPHDDAMTVEAGVALLEAQQAAAAAGRMFPLSLAAEGSATIGGVISTNAGGTAVLRYGVMRDLVLGIEAVLPDGEVFHGLKRLRKDNTGYDLKQL